MPSEQVFYFDERNELLPTPEGATYGKVVVYNDDDETYTSYLFYLNQEE